MESWSVSTPMLHFPHTPIFLPASGSHSPSRYSGGKPSFPITTRCIPIYFHSTSMGHTHTLTSQYGICCISYTAGLITTSVFVLCHVFLPAVTGGMVGRSHGGDSLKSKRHNFCCNTGDTHIRHTHTHMHPHWHQS